MKTARSIRLTSTSASTLVNSTAQSGEVFYDQTNKTLRLFDGRTKGGYQLLRADLANITGSFGVSVSSTPPTSPQAGTQWINANTGVLYVYYVDVNGGHWIQPVTLPVGELVVAPTLLVASIDDPGAVQPDGTSITIAEDGTISAVFGSIPYSDALFVGYTSAQLPSNIVNAIDGATGTVVNDTDVFGTTFYYTNVADNFTANFTNMPTTNNRATTLTLVIAQNNPGFIASGVQINGVSQTINWANGVVPSASIGGIDVIQFIILRVNNSWIVNGSLSKHGV